VIVSKLPGAVCKRSSRRQPARADRASPEQAPEDEAKPQGVGLRGSRLRDRTAYEQEGELSAAIELRRLFPGIIDNAEARECARTIAGWKPLPAVACKITRL
jgi:hypothetical protein